MLGYTLDKLIEALYEISDLIASHHQNYDAGTLGTYVFATKVETL